MNSIHVGLIDDDGAFLTGWDVALGGDDNRITQDAVDAFIECDEYITMGSKTTVGQARLANGYEVIVSSSCVDADNYDLRVGAEICRKRIEDKVWELLGFMLQCAIANDKHPGGAL